MTRERVGFALQAAGLVLMPVAVIVALTGGSLTLEFTLAAAGLAGIFLGRSLRTSA